MSMRNYSFEDYGLVFSESDVERIKRQIAEKEKRLPDEIELEEYFQEIGNFTGEAIKVKPDGSLNYDEEYLTFDYDSAYYIGLDNAVSLFNAAYKSIDEAAEELKEKASEYFPKDFNYADNIRCISGVYWG